MQQLGQAGHVGQRVRALTRSSSVRERSFEHMGEPSHDEAFVDVVERAPGQRVARERGVGVAGDHDDGDVGIAGAEALEHEIAGEVGEGEVEQDHIGLELRDKADPVAPGGCHPDGVAQRREDVVQHRRDLRLVIDDQDPASG
jgi:hypothetical protein